MVLRLDRIEPDNGGRCPDGYEYVSGHRERTGKYVRPFCRRKPRWQRKVDRELDKASYLIDSPKFEKLIEKMDKKMDEFEGK